MRSSSAVTSKMSLWLYNYYGIRSLRLLLRRRSMSDLPLHAIALIKRGGTTPEIGGFGHGSGLILMIVAAVMVGFVFVALFRAGRRGH